MNEVESPSNPPPMTSPLKLEPPPFWMIVAFMLLVVMTWVPLVLIARARTTHSDKPRIHIFQDMDVQPRYGPQSTSKVFADGRAMRMPVPGTVAQGELREDDHFYRGYTAELDESSDKWNVVYFNGLPEQVPANEQTMKLGAVRFNTYCAPCHGMDGYGNGRVYQRIEELQLGWVQPSNLHAPSGDGETLQFGRENYSDGRMFNTITHGVRTMAGYGKQMTPEDRWAVVLYLRALQRSQHARLADVPEQQREALLR